MPPLTIIGLGLLIFSIGASLIKTGRFTKTTHYNGITVIKDKNTGQEYIQTKNGFVTKL